MKGQGSSTSPPTLLSGNSLGVKISEDEAKRALKEVQQRTDEKIHHMEKLLHKKETEALHV